MIPQTTYLLNLVALDETLATFGADGTGASLDLPHEEWVKLERPGAVEITPRPTAPLR